MKKGLNLSQEQLEELYLEKKYSLNQIGKMLGCDGTNILYWLKKFNVKRRSAYRKKIHIPKDVLEDLYWNKKLSSTEIAKKFNIRHGRTILKKLKKYGIKSKSLSEANSKKFKAPFTGDLIEKAFFLGLRAGDFYAKQNHLCYRVQTTSTHVAQIHLCKLSFKNYGETKVYYSKNKARADEWFIYVDLHHSFNFLLNKPHQIPRGIMENDDAFYSFFSAYSDCEGTWYIINPPKRKYARIRFTIKAGDKIILGQIRDKLKALGFSPVLYLSTLKGCPGSYGPHHCDIYHLGLNRKQDVLRLIYKLLPYSKHTEKIRKMNFILQNWGKKWAEIERPWNELRAQIKSELLKNST